MTSIFWCYFTLSLKIRLFPSLFLGIFLLTSHLILPFSNYFDDVTHDIFRCPLRKYANHIHISTGVSEKTSTCNLNFYALLNFFFCCFVRHISAYKVWLILSLESSYKQLTEQKTYSEKSSSKFIEIFTVNSN